MAITAIAPGLNHPANNKLKPTVRFFAASDGSVFSRSQLIPSVSSVWDPTAIVAAPGIVTQFATGNDTGGLLNVFVLTPSGECYYILQNTPNGKDCQQRNIGAAGWQQIAFAHNYDGRLE